MQGLLEAVGQGAVPRDLRARQLQPGRPHLHALHPDQVDAHGLACAGLLRILQLVLDLGGDVHGLLDRGRVLEAHRTDDVLAKSPVGLELVHLRAHPLLLGVAAQQAVGQHPARGNEQVLPAPGVRPQDERHEPRFVGDRIQHRLLVLFAHARVPAPRQEQQKSQHRANSRTRASHSRRHAHHPTFRRALRQAWRQHPKSRGKRSQTDAIPAATCKTSEYPASFGQTAVTRDGMLTAPYVEAGLWLGLNLGCGYSLGDSGFATFLFRASLEQPDAPSTLPVGNRYHGPSATCPRPCQACPEGA